MTLAISHLTPPMEALTADALPRGKCWSYEPKWDGFRCIAFKDGREVRLQSRNQRPLERYFPELIAAFADFPVPRFVLDGELVVSGQPFDALQMRLHPAASRVAKLSVEYPARFIAFDCLVDERGRSLMAEPFSVRRGALTRIIAAISASPSLILSPATTSATTALRWLRQPLGIDGIVAKRRDEAYHPGKRAMVKYKQWKTVDTVVGGIYRKAGRREIEYLLLGLYDDNGLLHYIGRAPARDAPPKFLRRVDKLAGSGGFTGNRPGGPSRWSDRERHATPVK